MGHVCCNAFFCENKCYHTKRRQQYTDLTDSFEIYCSAFLIFNLEKKKDVNRLEIKDRDGDKISFLNLNVFGKLP